MRFGEHIMEFSPQPPLQGPVKWSLRLQGKRTVCLEKGWSAFRRLRTARSEVGGGQSRLRGRPSRSFELLWEKFILLCLTAQPTGYLQASTLFPAASFIPSERSQALPLPLLHSFLCV